jgi:hypothetical protein
MRHSAGRAQLAAVDHAHIGGGPGSPALRDKLRRHRSFRDSSSDEEARSSASTPSNKAPSPGNDSAARPATGELRWKHTAEVFTVARSSADQRSPAPRQQIPVLEGKLYWRGTPVCSNACASRVSTPGGLPPRGVRCVGCGAGRRWRWGRGAIARPSPTPAFAPARGRLVSAAAPCPGLPRAAPRACRRRCARPRPAVTMCARALVAAAWRRRILPHERSAHGAGRVQGGSTSWRSRHSTRRRHRGGTISPWTPPCATCRSATISVPSTSA